jgi:hypothetical protein
VGPKWIPIQKIKTGPKDLKQKRDSPPRRSLREMLQQGAGSSGAPLRGPAATSEPAVEISAKDSYEPAVRNLSKVRSETTLLGVSRTDTPLQGASTSSIPTAGEGLGHTVSEVGELRLAKKALSGCAKRKLKKARARESEAGTGGIQQPGNVNAPKQGETLTDILKRPRSEGSTPTETARAPKRPRDSKGPGNYKKALTNIKVAIFRETYPEDKLKEDDQNSILEVLGEVLCRTSIGEISHLKSYRLEGGALIYMCADQQSDQWLVKAIDNHRLESRARLKATGARNLPKPIKGALRIRDKVAQNQEELLNWIKNLNPGLSTEHWRVLDKQSEPKDQRLILFIDRDSYATIKRTGHKIFTGLSQETVKVLKDPEAQHKQDAMPDTASPKSFSEGEGDDLPTPSDDRCRADQETPSNGTQSENRDEVKEKMETDSSLNGKGHN